MSEIDEINKKKKKSSSVRYVKILKLYVVPIFSIGLFIVIIIGAIFPKISLIFSELDEINALNEQIAEKNNTLSQLAGISSKSALVLDQLSIINNIAPSGTTEVVNFRDRITKLSVENSLEISSQRFSEVVEPNLANLPNGGNDYIGVVGLQEVPSEFKMNGTLNNIKNFLQSLDKLEDFVVVKEMKLNYSGTDYSDIENKPWSFEVQVVKYQFSDKDSEELQIIYKRIPLTAEIDDKVKEYIDSRQSTTSTSN